MAEESQARIYAKASELSDRHTPEILNRSVDLMYVAAALLCVARLFLSTDTRQSKTAKAERMAVKPGTGFRENNLRAGSPSDPGARKTKVRPEHPARRNRPNPAKMEEPPRRGGRLPSRTSVE